MKSLSVKLAVILIGLIIFGCAGMREAHWKFFSSTDLYEGFYHVAERSHPYKGMVIVRVWIKLKYTEKGIAEYVKAFGKDYENLSYSLESWEIECKTRHYQILTISQYSIEGNIINTKPIKERFSEFLAKGLSEAVCK